MSITVELSPDTEKQVFDRAAAAGTDVGTFIREAVEEKLHRSRVSFSEILKPIHEEVRHSGLSEAELDELLAESLAETRQPANGSKNGRP